MHPRPPDAVKPVTPQKLIDRARADRQGMIRNATERVNAILEEHFENEGDEVAVPLEELGPDKEVREDVAQKFAYAGWLIDRVGPGYIFKKQPPASGDTL